MYTNKQYVTKKFGGLHDHCLLLTMRDPEGVKTCFSFHVMSSFSNIHLNAFFTNCRREVKQRFCTGERLLLRPSSLPGVPVS